MADSNMVPSQPIGEPVPVTSLTPSAPNYQLDGGEPVYWSNLPEKTDEGRALILKCHADADLKGNEMIGKVFDTKWLMAHPVEITDEKTGEITDAVRTVLVSPEGRTMSFVSSGILRSLRVMVMLYGRGPWDPPLPLEVKQINTRNSRRTFTLTIPVTPTKPLKGGK